MDKYEISLWESFPDQWTNPETGEVKTFINERKIAVIGSDTMEAQARAIEPKLVEEINGTNTFTFKMFYTYTDNQTGEKYDNPFGKYLINERKVKVYWKDQWYDFIIKKCQENSADKSIVYTCKDLFINELSKQGYNLEFTTDLQNNIGTAAELAQYTLQGSTWIYDENSSTPIIQKTEGPVYETVSKINFNAIKQDPSGNTENEIPQNKLILVFYDSLVNLLDITSVTTASVQFLYSEDDYQTDINDMVVINGDCYEVTLSFQKGNDNTLMAFLNEEEVFRISLNLGVSEHYTAKRLVKSQKAIYDSLLQRYVGLCKDADDNIVYEIATTEYTDPLAIVNLVANPNNFVNVSGWIGYADCFSIFPKFNSSSDILTYSAKSYLRLGTGYTYNSGIQSNISQLVPTDSEIKRGIIGGIQEGEKYIYRVKAWTNVDNAPNSKITATEGKESETVILNLYKYDPTNPSQTIDPQALFTYDKNNIEYKDEWLEFTLIANQSISANKIKEYGIFVIVNTDGIWLEDIQFFKYAEGITSYDENAETKRINPGEISIQSIVYPVYKYYYPNDDIIEAKDLTYIYNEKVPSESYTPVYNNYEKIGTIEEKESNRFNILQSIAETFQAWVKFKIKHEDNGAIQIINGVPQKFVYFVEELEKDNGLSFEYGIDLKTISRSIDSDKLATKVIVNPNNNEFGDQGFCSIARSNENYSKENFILNLDYFVSQNLLDKDCLDKDLYSIDDNYIGYYYYLHQYNSEYDEITDTLSTKTLDYLKQSSQREVYTQYISAAKQQLGNIQSDLQNLAGVESWEDVQPYAESHANNDKVQSLLNTYAKINNEIQEYVNNYNQINSSLEKLSTFINTLKERQKELIINIKEKHQQFNDKYSLYLMEGSWQDDNYTDDNKYYLDALKVAYTSSRPQLSYTINVLRLSGLKEFSSKVFNLGDICYIQDREFFGYLNDKITPYKEKILVSKISSCFDQPEKDELVVQNYKTRFDDLFQRIAATSQNLEYSEGSFQRAANAINSDGTIDSNMLQSTFDQNVDLVLSSSNQDVVWDNTGITVTDKVNGGNKTKILAGGIFVTNDGGVTWKNAIRGDGISTNLLTSGRINTSEIYIYDGGAPSFRWDSQGLTAYSYDVNGVNFGKFVRFDKYGIYGYSGVEDSDFVPTSESQISNVASFGLIWSGFFLRNSNNTSKFEISTANDLVISNNNITRVKLGRLNNNNDDYGLALYNENGEVVVLSSTQNKTTTIGGWSIGPNEIYYQDKNDEEQYIRLDGTNGVIKGKYLVTENETSYYGSWELGCATPNRGLKIDDNNAIIAIKQVEIDSTGIQIGKDWVIDTEEGLKYQNKSVSIFNLNTGSELTKSDDLDGFVVPGIFEYTASSSYTTVIEQQNVSLDENGEATLESGFNYYNLSYGDKIFITIDNTEEEVTIASNSDDLIASTTSTIPQIALRLSDSLCTSNTSNASFTLSAQANIKPKNIPTDDSFKMSVMKVTEDCIVQTLYQINSMNEYRRHYNYTNNIWSNWQCITGALTLDSVCYGSALPSPGTVGRLFFVEI